MGEVEGADRVGGRHRGLGVISQAAEHLAKVWNHPDVQPWVALGNPDFLTAENAQKILDSGALYLANEHGGFLVVPGEGNVWEVHTQFTPEGRGSGAMDFALKQIRYMFEKTPAVALRTFCPDGNPAARALAKRCGFVNVGTSSIVGRSGAIFVLTIKKWVQDRCRQQH